MWDRQSANPTKHRDMSRYHERERGPGDDRRARLAQLNPPLRIVCDALLEDAKLMAWCPEANYASVLVAVVHSIPRLTLIKISDGIRESVPSILREAGIASGRALAVDISTRCVVTVFLEGHEGSLREAAVRNIANTIQERSAAGVTGAFLSAQTTFLFHSEDLRQRLQAILPPPLAATLWVNMPVVTWESTIGPSARPTVDPTSLRPNEWDAFYVVRADQRAEVCIRELRAIPYRAHWPADRRQEMVNSWKLISCKDETQSRDLEAQLSTIVTCRRFRDVTRNDYVITAQASWDFSIDPTRLQRGITVLLNRVKQEGMIHQRNVHMITSHIGGTAWRVDEHVLRTEVGRMTAEAKVRAETGTPEEKASARADLELLPLIRCFHREGDFSLVITHNEHDARVRDAVRGTIPIEDLADLVLDYYAEDSQ